MSAPVTRRAFLVGLAGAAGVGWVWLRERSPSDAAAGSTTTTLDEPTATPSTTTSTSLTSTSPPTTSITTSTTTLAPGILIEAICRDAWGAAEPTAPYREHTINQLTVHHTARRLRANRDAPAAVRGHQRFHQADRGWADIAYHYIIDLEGNIYECRPVSAAGDTATTYDPTGHFLVCCEGDFNTQELPETQREALVNVLAWAAREFATDPATIKGHRDLATTTCPGENLYSLIESGALRAAVDEALATGGVTMETLCGARAFDRISAIEA